mmetsp:Transcript_28722/g.35196  ORF Transcript_28722/g.35196 Transcript_28722/m.35196 type:complete len:159 (+) Transcript_28722:2-478(+)
MGVCRSFPDGYLGKNPDAASFWFDDGDAYTAGQRFHAGRLTSCVPMEDGDRVGVLVDLRSPEQFALEFVLNRRSTGVCPRMEEVYVPGEPLFPCLSFCTNHLGCEAQITCLGEPPEDISTGDVDDELSWNPRMFQRPEQRSCSRLGMAGMAQNNFKNI